MALLKRLSVRNYRCIKAVDFDARPINVFFGPNGVGKTTFLDALWFVRDCAIRGTEEAASGRHHGIGMLSDSADPGSDNLRVKIETERAEYEVRFGYSHGRIEPFVGERLYSKERKLTLVDRKVGSPRATFHSQDGGSQVTEFHDAARLSFPGYHSVNLGDAAVSEIDTLLWSTRLYTSRLVNLQKLRRAGSETTAHTNVSDHWDNLWSALRNLDGLRVRNDRIKRIYAYMRDALPNSFRGLEFEQRGPTHVGALFIEAGRSKPIEAAHVSDGHLQLLGLLTCLFGDSDRPSSIILFDEPETSLHPHAIAVFANAVREATEKYGRQIFIATHSPVLLSQFEPEDVVLAERDDQGDTALRRVSEIPGIGDLAEHYALGSLYMAEEVGKQSSAQADASDGE